eukprot:COSAG02_NODE_24032_length_700_cov_0.655574_1_plen_179_part_01
MRTDFRGHPRYPSSPGRSVPHTPLAARLGSPSSPRSHHSVQLAPLGAAQQYARANTVVSGPPASKQSPVAYDIFGRRSAAAPAPFERAMTPGRSVIRHNNHGEQCSPIHSGLPHHVSVLYQSALRCRVQFHIQMAELLVPAGNYFSAALSVDEANSSTKDRPIEARVVFWLFWLLANTY